MEYVAIDFQTANKWHKSACSVALVTVKDGKIIDTFYSLIRPGILHFDKENTALHGITKEMVKDAPGEKEGNSRLPPHQTTFGDGGSPPPPFRER
mgnify:CR=1 FL=1